VSPITGLPESACDGHSKHPRGTSGPSSLLRQWSWHSSAAPLVSEPAPLSTATAIYPSTNDQAPVRVRSLSPARRQSMSALDASFGLEPIGAHVPVPAVRARDGVAPADDAHDPVCAIKVRPVRRLEGPSDRLETDDQPFLRPAGPSRTHRRCSRGRCPRHQWLGSRPARPVVFGRLGHRVERRRVPGITLPGDHASWGSGFLGITATACVRRPYIAPASDAGPFYGGIVG
jgi:hypothetical protein